MTSVVTETHWIYTSQEWFLCMWIITGLHCVTLHKLHHEMKLDLQHAINYTNKVCVCGWGESWRKLLFYQWGCPTPPALFLSVTSVVLWHPGIGKPITGEMQQLQFCAVMSWRYQITGGPIQTALLASGGPTAPLTCFQTPPKFGGTWRVYVISHSAHSRSALCGPVDCSPPGSSVHGVSQARTLERVAISFSRGSYNPRDQTHISCIAGGFFPSETPVKPAWWHQNQWRRSWAL